MLWAYIGVILVSLAAADPEGYRCCTPKQWEGKFAEVGSLKFGYHVIGYTDYSKMSYDGSTRQIAVDMHYYSRYKKGEVKFILNFRKRKMYIIYGKRCRIRTITFPFKPACISDKSKKLGSTYLGAGAHKLDVTSYQRYKKGVYVMTTVTKDCIPVSEIVSAKIRRANIFKDISYFGITPGIKDRRVFVPPPSCRREMFDDVLRVKDAGEKELEEMIKYVIHKFTA